MNKHAIEILEYNKIKEELRKFAISQQAKKMIDKLEPYIDINLIEGYMQETTEARTIVDISSSVPIHSLNGMKNIKAKLEKQQILSPAEFELISSFIREGKRLKRFIQNKEYAAPNISSYALSIYELDDLVDEIDRCITRSRVGDKASGVLSKIRKKIFIVEERIKSKLDSYLKNSEYMEYMHDHVVSQRDGRYVIPIKSNYKSNVEGNVLDTSRSGSTVFIELAAVKKLHDQLSTLRTEEENEIYKMLSSLTAFVSQYEREILINMETMIHYDFLFAKAKYSKSIDGRSVKLNTDNYIDIKSGRHPLLGNSSVPLDFEIGSKYRRKDSCFKNSWPFNYDGTIRTSCSCR